MEKDEFGARLPIMLPRATSCLATKQKVASRQNCWRRHMWAVACRCTRKPHAPRRAPTPIHQKSPQPIKTLHSLHATVHCTRL